MMQQQQQQQQPASAALAIVPFYERTNERGYISEHRGKSTTANNDKNRFWVDING
jgi:hypothetical protein